MEALRVLLYAPHSWLECKSEYFLAFYFYFEEEAGFFQLEDNLCMI